TSALVLFFGRLVGWGFGRLFVFAVGFGRFVAAVSLGRLVAVGFGWLITAGVGGRRRLVAARIIVIIVVIVAASSEQPRQRHQADAAGHPLEKASAVDSHLYDLRQQRLRFSVGRHGSSSIRRQGQRCAG